jgi:hypothetical protein
MFAVPYLGNGGVVLVDVGTELKSEDEGDEAEVIICADHAEMAPVGQDTVVRLGSEAEDDGWLDNEEDMFVP